VVDVPLQTIFEVADIDVGLGGGGVIQVNNIEKGLEDEYP
jgi:hypothetical protein